MLVIRITTVIYHKRHFNINYTYEVISLLIFAYKAAGSTPATGRIAVLHNVYQKRGGVDTGVDIVLDLDAHHWQRHTHIMSCSYHVHKKRSTYQ